MNWAYIETNVYEGIWIKNAKKKITKKQIQIQQPLRRMPNHNAVYRKTNITFESTTTKLKKSHHRKSKTWSLYPHPHPYRNRYHCVIGVFSWIFLMIFSRGHASRTRGEQSEMLESISRKKNTSRKQTFFPKCK